MPEKSPATDASPFLINGDWRRSDKTRSVVNPYTKQPVGSVCQALPADVSDAINAAVAAFQTTRKLQAYERAQILLFIARGIEGRKEEFARLITTETGKPITYSRAEVERSIFTFTIAAEEARRIEGEVLPLDLDIRSSGRFGIVRRFPIGPIAAITPFNFPLNLVAHKIAPAIAAGNTVVLKPSSNSPQVALDLARIIESSGLPPGALNVVPCSRGEAAQLIVNEQIKLISFTGSPHVGWGLKSRAGKKKVVLELGGNAGVIVDAGTDLESSVQRIAQGSYGNAGQSCIAVQRIFVHEQVYPAFVSRFVEVSRSIPVGDPFNDKTVVGPLIDEEAAKKVEGWIQEAVAAGAKILCGGSRKGTLLDPTVLVDVKPEMKVCSQEVFAPVVTIAPFRDLKQAVSMVNDSSYGLQAGLFTNDLKGMFSAYQEIEVGGLIINDFPTYRIDHMPYGGVKDSGFGREGVKYAIEEMTELKLLAVNPG